MSSLCKQTDTISQLSFPDDENIINYDSIVIMLQYFLTQNPLALQILQPADFNLDISPSDLDQYMYIYKDIFEPLFTLLITGSRRQLTFAFNSVKEPMFIIVKTEDGHILTSELSLPVNVMINIVDKLNSRLKNMYKREVHIALIECNSKIEY